MDPMCVQLKCSLDGFKAVDSVAKHEPMKIPTPTRVDVGDSLRRQLEQAREENARLLALNQAQFLLAQQHALLSLSGMATSFASLPPAFMLPSKAADCEVTSDCSTSTIAMTTSSTSTEYDIEAAPRREQHMVRTQHQKAGGQVERSTVIMQNIPNRHTRTMLLALLDKAGFRGAYNLVYLPIDFATKVCFGYAFVHFVSATEAETFMPHFHGFKAWGCNSEKVCNVTWGGNQGGLDTLIRKYRNCSVMHETVPDEFKPALFSQGERIPFPAPTQKLRKPRAPPADESIKPHAPVVAHV